MNKMNAIVNKSLLNGDKFMPGLHLRQTRFIAFVDCLLNVMKELKHLEKQVL